MENLDKYLIEFETNFTANGGKVIWANDEKEAQQEILKILQKKEARMVVKAKSMATEEIHLNEFLGEHNIESVETDLGNTFSSWMEKRLIILLHRQCIKVKMMLPNCLTRN